MFEFDRIVVAVVEDVVVSARLVEGTEAHAIEDLVDMVEAEFAALAAFAPGLFADPAFEIGVVVLREVVLDQVEDRTRALAIEVDQIVDEGVHAGVAVVAPLDQGVVGNRSHSSIMRADDVREMDVV